MTRPVASLSFGVGAHRPPVKEKIFVIGAPKTGTSSVGVALQMLGFHDYGWDPVMQDYYHFSNLNPIWEHVGRYDSFSDGPFNTGDFYKVLFHRFPTSKFILTVREKESWKKSFLAHFSPEAKNPIVPGRYRLHKIIQDDWWSWYDRRNAEIESFFLQNNAANRLIKMNVASEESETLWKRLCNFIGVSEPSLAEKFPHTNKDPNKP